jgi:hypothetical protein
MSRHPRLFDACHSQVSRDTFHQDFGRCSGLNTKPLPRTRPGAQPYAFMGVTRETHNESRYV